MKINPKEDRPSAVFAILLIIGAFVLGMLIGTCALGCATTTPVVAEEPFEEVYTEELVMPTGDPFLCNQQECIDYLGQIAITLTAGMPYAPFNLYDEGEGLAMRGYMFILDGALWMDGEISADGKDPWYELKTRVGGGE